jgi:N-methylhydantoinase B
MVALNQLLCWGQYFSVGGALRHVDFNPTPGTLNCASFPASVSTAPVQAMEISLYPAYNVISKMIFADPEMRKDVMCIGGTSQWPATIFRGIDQWGERYGYLLVDPIGGAIGAFSTQDGISTGGQSRTPICKLPNIEHTEQSFPLLFLYRKEVPDSGGAGRFRGGLSAESCFIPHNTDKVVQDTLSSGNAIPTSTGMMGGYPGATNGYRFVRNTDILERLARRAMVDDIAEIPGETVTLGLRQENFEQHPPDVYAVVWTAAGGFGDPMERDPALVFEDWQNGAVTLRAAREIYGVVIDEKAGALDGKATIFLREAKRRARTERRSAMPRALKGPIALRITDNLLIRLDGRTPHHCCARCDADLGPASDNYKDHCLREDNSVTHATPLAGDPHRYIDAEPVFRQFFCPGCGGLIENEMALASDPVLRDIAIIVDESTIERPREAAE